MIEIRILTPKLRKKLKSPLGQLIKGSSNETMIQLQRLVEKEKPSKIVSVGDAVSSNMEKNDILSHVMIVDNKVMRQPITPFPVKIDHILHVTNPPGTLTDELWSIVRESLDMEQRTKIVVNGEEDLVTLVAVMCVPEGSFVIYGQPHEGIVVVRANKKKREIVRRIVEEMEES